MGNPGQPAATWPGVLAILLGSSVLITGSPVSAESPPDLSTVKPDLVVASLRTGPPRAGARVKQVLAGYEKTRVYHVIRLPEDWQPGKSYPVIVELAGNGPYRSPFGDISTGRPEGSKLGLGLSAGKGFIWICLPFLNAKGNDIATRWWGDRPTYDPGPTIRYIKQAVPALCRRWGGDRRRVVLAGFSRGAIACNFIGLYDDEIAGLWAAMIPYSHYDGVFPGWGYPGADRAAALQRLKRLGNRPQFICHENSTNKLRNLPATRGYLSATKVTGRFSFRSTGFRNHNDAWVLRPSPARDALRAWLQDVLEQARD
ncbi:MAG: hypothetical protein CMJ65_01895 [Planctomycetaceae bacterium]|nr:hypothetical protein [Planctomycetaceae bacterium]